MILNLAANAHDAMPRGGWPIVTTAKVELGGPTSEQHPHVTTSRYIRLSVRDTGSAMSDLVMPKLSGREMADRLTALKPGLRVLFMSGYTEDVVIQQGVNSSTVDFLHKPFDVAALTQKVREILDRE